ncbi:MAG: hypothetical protein WB504_14960, partial [Pseudolabrys sp.]
DVNSYFDISVIGFVLRSLLGQVFVAATNTGLPQAFWRATMLPTVKSSLQEQQLLWWEGV